MLAGIVIGLLLAFVFWPRGGKAVTFEKSKVIPSVYVVKTLKHPRWRP